MFGRNAYKNINIIIEKINLLKLAGDHASDYQIALDFYDAALNIQSRLLGDDKKSYADILLSKAIKSFKENKLHISEELIESFKKCLEIFYDDERNNKKELLKAHRYLALVYANDPLNDMVNIDEKIMNGRKTITLTFLGVIFARKILVLEN